MATKAWFQRTKMKAYHLSNSKSVTRDPFFEGSVKSTEILSIQDVSSVCISLFPDTAGLTKNGFPGLLRNGHHSRIIGMAKRIDSKIFSKGEKEGRIAGK